MDENETENCNVNCNVSEAIRTVECEVCGSHEAKYTCPRCEVRTCCLECVKIHKKELDCNGLRDKVKFKQLKNFNNIDLLNDYRLLEETARVVGKAGTLPPISCFNSKFGQLPGDLYRLRSAALRRGVHLHYLPPSFTRHKKNTSFLDHQAQKLYWRIDWIFPQAENITFTDDRVLDSSILSACVHKYIEPDGATKYSSMTFYQSAGHPGIKLLLKAERTSADRFHLLEPSETVEENLSGKTIIEYPVIYVILSHHLQSYNIFNEDEENILRNRSKRWHFLNKNIPAFARNFLFSAEENQNNKGNCNVTAENPENQEVGVPRLQYHQSRGRRRHFYQNKINVTRGRGRRRQFNQNNSDTMFERPINGSLSSNFSSVQI